MVLTITFYDNKPASYIYDNIMFSSLIFLIPLLPCLVLLYKWFTVPSSNQPPSPTKLPIIGNLHQLGSAPHRSLQKLSKEYGPLMQLHLGKVPVIIISSAELASQVMKTDDRIFANRPKASFPDRLLHGANDIAFAPYGEDWRKARSICVHHLLSTQRVKAYFNIRDEETSLMLQNIETLCAFGPINLREMFVSLMNDVICRAVLGMKYNDNTKDWRDLLSALMESIRILGVFNIRDYIPWLGWLNYLTGLGKKFDELCKKTDTFLELVIEEHRKKMEKIGYVSVSAAEEDFVDILLKLQRDEEASIQNQAIKGILWDMFAAGTDTSAVLEWAMSELMKKPETMKKLQYEVRQIAQGKNVTEDDILNMKYLKAVIKETLRLHAIVPLLLPRETTQDVKVMDYNIKSGTRVIINAWAIGRDPSYWENAEEFEPERFLNSKIDFNGFDFEFIPFGAGRRGCPGITFAISLIELGLAKLVHKFNFSLPDGLRGEELDMMDLYGITLHRNTPLLVDVTIYDSY